MRAHVGHDRLRGELQVALRVAGTKAGSLLERHLRRHVAGERVVSRGLVRDEVEELTARHELGERRRPRSRAAPPTAACRSAAAARTRATASSSDVGLLVDVARREPPVDRPLIDLDAEDRRPGHRRGERLRAAHATEPGRQDRSPREVGGAEVHLPGSAERLVRALQDPLRPDVDPRSRGHLAEHRQPLRLEPAELVPGRPPRDEQRVRDQHAGSALVRPEHAHRLPGLDEERLVVLEAEQRPHDLPQGLVRPRRAAGAAVDDELLRMLGDLGVEVVQQHPQRRLGLPRERVQRRSPRRPHRGEVTAQSLDRRVDVAHAPVPPRPLPFRALAAAPRSSAAAAWRRRAP